MAAHELTGARIRERRLDQGLRQADVAEAAGISASYLNLIEHNKRRIGGKLLTALARALNTDAAALAQGADREILDAMQAAAARAAAQVEGNRAEDLATRFPGWAALIAAQGARIETLEAEIRVLRDRMSHDPVLARALHDVITAVTSIQATAGILASDDSLDSDWQRRFHVNIHDDSQRLAKESEALVAYLEAPATDRARPDVVVGFEELETFLAMTPALALACAKRPDVNIAALLTAYEPLSLSADGRHLLMAHLRQIQTDTMMLPHQTFEAAAKAAQYDPAILAANFQAPLSAVLRRLAALPVQNGLPPMGLIVGDATGAITYLKQIPGFAPSRHVAGCPLWPFYTALTHPAQPIRAEVALPGQAGARFLCYAVATAKGPAQFNTMPVFESTMLVVSDPEPGGTPPVPVGMSCRICPRNDCTARREPSAIMRA